MSSESISKKENQAQYNESRKRKRLMPKKPSFQLEISVCNGDDDRLNYRLMIVCRYVTTLFYYFMIPNFL